MYVYEFGLVKSDYPDWLVFEGLPSRRGPNMSLVLICPPLLKRLVRLLP